MKIAYISADIEGVTGVVSPAQTVLQGFEFERARHWMTAEVKAVCEGALAAGADACIVSDSHGNGQNLLLESLPRATQVVRAWPRPLGMMQGVESSGVFGAALIGYHTSARSAHGVLAHSFSGRTVAGLAINGVEASESTVSAAIAGAFGVPVLLASGDADYGNHIRDLLGDDLPTVITKVAHGRYSATCRHPDEVLDELRSTSEMAFSQPDRSVYEIELPASVELCFQRHAPAELLAYLECFERVDGTTVRFTADSVPALAKTLFFATHVGVDEQIPS